MSQKNVEIVRAIYEEWGKGNFRAGRELWDGRVVFVPGLALGVGDFLGPEAIIAFMTDWLRQWTTYTIAADELIGAGDSVVVTTHQRGVGRESGVTAEVQESHVWTFRGRKVIRFEAFQERVDAFEAVGLPARAGRREWLR